MQVTTIRVELSNYVTRCINDMALQLVGPGEDRLPSTLNTRWTSFPCVTFFVHNEQPRLAGLGDRAGHADQINARCSQGVLNLTLPYR